MDCQIRLASPLQTDSIVDGPGLRFVLWAQGCKHSCNGCHNRETWKMDGGFLESVSKVKKEILSNKTQTGLTLSGGDPFFQPVPFAIIAKYAKKKGLSVWAYSGYTIDELLKLSKKDNDILELLNSIDYLIDGQFILEQRTLSLLYRGSKNQIIIDVRETLKTGSIVVERKYDKRESLVSNNEKHRVFM